MTELFSHSRLASFEDYRGRGEPLAATALEAAVAAGAEAYRAKAEALSAQRRAASFSGCRVRHSARWPRD